MLGKEDIIRLRHMLETAKDAISITQNRTRSSLDTDKMLRLSLERSMEIIGEAASRLSKECYDELPQIPWKNIINMRNRLIHAYYNINLNTLWSSVTEDLPGLIAELEKKVPSIEKP